MKILTFILSTVFLSACSPNSSEGDFNRLTFAPLEMTFAIHDRHTFIENGEQLTAIRKNATDLKVDLYFSGAKSNPEQDWRFYSTEKHNNLRRELATKDALIIRHLPLNQVLAERTLTWSTTSAAAKNITLQNADNEVGEIDFYLSHDATKIQGLQNSANLPAIGQKLEVKLVLNQTEVEPSSGYIEGSLELKRSRGENQQGDVAVGEIVLHFTLPILPERVAKANAKMLIPIVQCAALAGPNTQIACAKEPAEKVLDENNTF